MRPIARLLAAAFLPLLLAGAPAWAEGVYLHTVGKGNPIAYRVEVGGSGSTKLETMGAFPGNLLLLWQLPLQGKLQGKIYGLINNPFRYTIAGAGADGTGPMEWGAAKAALEDQGVLSAGAGVPRTVAIATTPTRDGRYLIVFESRARNSISLVEFDAVDGKLGATSWHVVKLGAEYNLSDDNLGLLGAGFAWGRSQNDSEDSGHVVVGGAKTTYVLKYRTSDGNRLSDLASVPNPAGFQYVSAGPADDSGKAFWVFGIKGDRGEVRYLNLNADPIGYQLEPVATIPFVKGTDVAFPAFDALQPTQVAIVVSRAGAATGTNVYVLKDLAPKQATRTQTGPTSANPDFDFSRMPQLPPVVAANGNGFLVGRTSGSQEKLYRFSFSNGTIEETGVAFGSETHETLVLQKRDTESVSIERTSPETVAGGEKATFRVTRTGACLEPYTVTYEVEDDEVPGVDWVEPLPALVIPAGAKVAMLEIATREIKGCQDARSFYVTLKDANVAIPAGGSTAVQSRSAATECTLTLTPPVGQVIAGASSQFTLGRSGDPSWPLTVTLSTDSASEVGVPASAVIEAGQAMATIAVTTTVPQTTCRAAKEFKVTAAHAALATVSATASATIAAITGSCSAIIKVTPSPQKAPALPGERLVLTITEPAGTGLLDLTKTVWSFDPAPGPTTFRIVPPALSGTTATKADDAVTGESVTIQYLGAIKDGVKVSAAVKKTDGTPAAGATPPEVLNPVANWSDLVRLDGPSQLSEAITRSRRFRAIWKGSAARIADFSKIGDANAGDGGGLRWELVSPKEGGGETVVEADGCRGERVCEVTSLAVATTKVRTYVLAGEQQLTVQEMGLVDVGTLDPNRTELAVRYLPVALEATGEHGAAFETEVTLVNRTGKTVLARLEYGGFFQEEAVGARRQLVVNGLVERLRETKSDISGAALPVKVTFGGLSDEDLDGVDVVARVTTPVGLDPVPPLKARGRAGLAFKALRSEEFFGDPAGTPKRLPTANLIGLRGTSRDPKESFDRTNVAIVAPEGETKVTVTGLKENGTEAFKQESLTVGAFRQFSPEELKGAAWVTVTWKAGGPFTCYATPIDNKTNDGAFVFPQAGRDGDAKALVVPVLLEVPLDQTRFKFLSDLALTSTSNEIQDVRLEYFWSEKPAVLDRALTGQTILGYSSTPPTPSEGAAKAFRESAENKPGGSPLGPVLVTMQTPATGGTPILDAGELFAGVRVFGPAANDPDAVNGFFSTYVPAVPLTDLESLSEIRILGLRNDAENRTNLALVNPGAEEIELRVEVYGGGATNAQFPVAACGALAFGETGTLKLGPREFCQIGGVLGGLKGAGGAALTSGWAVIKQVRGATENVKPFLAYGVTNDNTTNDGAYLPPFLVDIRETPPPPPPPPPATPTSLVIVSPASSMQEPIGLNEGPGVELNVKVMSREGGGVPGISVQFEVRRPDDPDKTYAVLANGEDEAGMVSVVSGPDGTAKVTLKRPETAVTGTYLVEVWLKKPYDNLPGVKFFIENVEAP